MWNRLDNRKKNMMLVLAGVLLLYVCYVFSFRQTIDAIGLNGQLQKQQLNEHTLDGSFGQIKDKNDFYLTVLKGYRVKKEDRENRLWQAISVMALANGVEVSFNPAMVSIADTTVLKKGVVEQQFSFRGSYFHLVKLLDTVSKTDGIGRISSLKLTAKKDNDLKEDERLRLQLTLVGVER